MKHIQWTARYLSVPTVVRYCKKCGAKTPFISSGLFRVNAQQKSLDVWLIYRCATCNTTWNFTIFSRVNPRSLPAELLDGFHINNDRLAMQYATDPTLIQRNSVEPCIPELEIVGETVSEHALVQLVVEYPSEYKAATALREKLGLSRAEFDRWLEIGKLACTSGHNLKKCKLSESITIEIR